MKYEFHPLKLTTSSAQKTMIINLLISYKYIEYQKLSCHSYENSEYELLKLKFHSTNNQKLRNRLTF